ncbi:BTAD domain-containing putative transcriptional regulator [Georgenia sp. M64]|uniref:BTAD domain-containing putative transcriptional regulator n=1 Tax=Georgenia sp. M64 TaxID=3120520 RepID=UPI0030DE2851
MRVGVLGPVEAFLDGPLDLGTRKQRALVAALALHRGRPVAVDTIIDLLWGDDPPEAVAGTLQAYVARLRRVLEPDRPARAPATVLVTIEPGYALRLAPEDLDAAVFEQVTGHARRLLAPAARVLEGLAPTGARTDPAGARTDPAGGRPAGRQAGPLPAGVLEDAVARLESALDLWRGEPYVELEDAPSAVAERARLEELRLLALEDLAVARLALGRHGQAAAELEALTSAHPLRERLWALRALALARGGRHADALDVLRRVREVLSDELGLDPAAELRALQAAVLTQDPALAVPPPVTAGTRAAPADQDAAQDAAPAAPRAAPPTGGDRADPTPLPRLPSWPMVGRDSELVALTGLLDAADRGSPSFAALVGEPGIGKSRLSHELLVLARARGARVLVGRCSQDDGAPPLWPWAAVLRGLGEDLPLGPGGQDEGAGFRTWEAIVTALVAAARERTVVVVLDDLHWADPASLRVLRLLAETAESGRLLVLCTWREHPEPVGPLAEAAAALARRHALRLTLHGLDATAVGAVVAAVAETTPTGAEADALRERTDGNPFFLVEYARLARERRDLPGLLAEPDPPSAVREVLLRRLERLPGPTVAALRAASVVGRRFDVSSLAAAAGGDEDELLDHLDLALAAGLVRDEGVDRFSFSHALVRDTVRSQLSSTRRARTHARVAAHLAGLPGREVEAAHHWLAAGPAHAAHAWRAAVAAAGAVRRFHAYEQAAELLTSALTSIDVAGGATARERYDVLLDLVDAYRWAGSWEGLVATAERAVAVAEEIGDVELLVRAASAPTVGALWQSAPEGQVHAGMVATLRRALERVGPGDGAVRCRALLSLANELYHGAGVAERRALLEEAIAMARRLGEEVLLLDACEVACATLQGPATVRERLAWSQEAARIAGRIGYERTYLVALCLRAGVEGELGMVGPMRTTIDEARVLATRLRVPFGLIVLANLEVPWLAMAGRFDEAQEWVARLEELDRMTGIHQSGEALAGAMAALRLWQGRSAESVPALMAMDAGPQPLATTVAVFLLRAGRVDEARAYLAAHPATLDDESFVALLGSCMAGEAALGLGDAALGAAAYERAVPYAGLSCSAGSANASGPVDAYLALAAAATGDLAAAARHADRAAELCRGWEIPLAGRWLAAQRERYGF